MSGLMELGPMTAEIVVMGSPLKLKPISVEQLIVLFDQFPVLVQLLGGPGKDALKLAGPIAIANVIATSTGEGDDPEAIERARQLGAGAVAAIMDKIVEITFEDGTENFMMRIKRATGNIKTLMSEDSSEDSSAPWSASLAGDPLSKKRSHLARVS